ncbi:hypothetical protein FVR03_18895 [Pontibacter qinzhouensis]|uniref:Tetratricopeptide repeat protein n=1 Tax=Pontibacter qinzhouensis TaxID=2603253 RepID=A0A5C8J8L5_9BACT|nr:hypothetical protein [Pontibacter qinzhouensis]TXK33728.1 hypothetical protein FVR03_18895 [Pontibacter qinzhouensis]
MSKKKKKPAAATPAKLNDKNYLISGRARSLPIYKCQVNQGWQESGMAEVLVMRKHANEHITVGIYLVDTFCTGVKSTFYLFNISEQELEERMAKAPFPQEQCSYELAHNIIYGGLAYAQEYGIAPDPDFRITQMILEEDTEDIELIELEFGKDGKPFLAINPAGDPRADYYIRQLEKNAGPGNFHIIDGRILDELDEMEEEDDYYAHPEEWEKVDWEEFIDEMEPEDLDDFPEATALMYEKLLLAPARTNQIATTKTQVEEIKISFDAMPLPYSEEELEEASSIAFKLVSDTLADSEKQELLERVKQAIERWPENRTFYSHLIAAYSSVSDEENVEKASNELYEKFPNYIFARIRRAEQLLQKGETDQVPAVFDNNYTLKALYPDRDTFHISEFIHFKRVLCHYFYQKGELDRAFTHYKLLTGIDLPETVRLDYELISNVEMALVDEIEPLLLEAKESEEKKQELIAKLVS